MAEPRLAGKQREQMVELIRQPLAAWIESILASSFPKRSSQALDITSEAMALAVMDTLGKTKEGKAALHAYALELFKQTGETNGR